VIFVSAEHASVRPAAVEDLDMIAKIFAQYVINSVATFEEIPLPVGAWRQRFDDLTTLGLPLLVAEVGGEVAGYAYASPWRPRPAYRYTVEDSIYLAPEWTGKGLGRLLLDALLAACTKAGARQMIAVIADTGRLASAALHRSCGFVDAGQLKEVGYKHGRWIDTLLLQRDLVAPDQRRARRSEEMAE
jgi:L-amino acid N-acyltransferase YncA